MRRLRLNVVNVSPGYVTCSLFQSDNGVNWACVGTGVTFGEEWFAKVFGKATEGRRIEFEIENPMEVTE